MNPPTQQVDQHGFPVPPKFDDQHPVPVRRRGLAGLRFGRWIVLLLLMAIVAGLAMELGMGTTARDAWVEYLFDRAQTKKDGHDLSGALNDLDRAVAWLDEHTDPKLAAKVFIRRGFLQLERK